MVSELVWDRRGRFSDLLEENPVTSLSLRRGLPGGEPRGHCFCWCWSRPVKTQGAVLALRLFLLLHPQGFWKGLHTEVPAEKHRGA